MSKFDEMVVSSMFEIVETLESKTEVFDPAIQLASRRVRGPGIERYWCATWFIGELGTLHTYQANDIEVLLDAVKTWALEGGPQILIIPDKQS